MRSNQRCFDKLTFVGKGGGGEEEEEEEEEEDDDDDDDEVAVLFEGEVCMDSLAAVGGMGGDIEACIERYNNMH